MKRTKSETGTEQVHLPTARRRTLRTKEFDVYEHRFYRNLCESGSLCIVFFEIDAPNAEALNRAVRAAAERFYAERQRRAPQSAISVFFSVTAVSDETKKDALKVVCEHRRKNLSQSETHRAMRLLVDTKNFRFCRRRDLTKMAKISIL